MQQDVRQLASIDINFPTPIPVHITYQTAFVDDAGKLQIRDDIYGRDARVLAALKGDERRMADVPVERPQPSYARPPVRLPERYRQRLRSAAAGRSSTGCSAADRPSRRRRSATTTGAPSRADRGRDLTRNGAVAAPFSFGAAQLPALDGTSAHRRASRSKI